MVLFFIIILFISWQATVNILQPTQHKLSLQCQTKSSQEVISWHYLAGAIACTQCYITKSTLQTFHIVSQFNKLVKD